MFYERWALVAGPERGQGRRNHDALLGPEKSRSGPEALPGSDPRVWARGHVAMASPGEVPGPTLQPIRPRPRILRRVAHEVEGKKRNVSGSVGG